MLLCHRVSTLTNCRDPFSRKSFKNDDVSREAGGWQQAKKEWGGLIVSSANNIDMFFQITKFSKIL